MKPGDTTQSRRTRSRFMLAARPDGVEDATVAMERFKRLARGLLSVSREELEAKRREHEQDRKTKSARPKPRAAGG